MAKGLGTLVVVLAVLTAGPCLAQSDPFGDHRRADGTLDWSTLLEQNHQTPARLKNFSLESFVRELGRVVVAGDRQRVSEFFDGVVATDFYKNYGVFVLAATATEVGYDMAYRRYLHRFLKPQFMSSVLRANVSLATGLALAQLMNGNFNGKVFAISMGSLGLSSAAVSYGMSRIPWIRKFQAASKAAGAARLLRAGSFIYQTAELALVFFVGRIVENYYYHYAERKTARDQMGEAADRVLRELEEATDAANVALALEHYSGAWNDYRNSLYGPLFRARLEFLERLDKLAKTAKVADDEVAKAMALRDRFPGLPLKAFAARRQGGLEDRTDRELETILSAYLSDWETEFAAVYTGNRTYEDPFVEAIYKIEAGQEGSGLGKLFKDAHDDVSRNRLESYIQQRTALKVLVLLYPDHDAVIQDALARLRRLELADTALSKNESGILPFSLGENSAGDAAGLVGSMNR